VVQWPRRGSSTGGTVARRGSSTGGTVAKKGLFNRWYSGQKGLFHRWYSGKGLALPPVVQWPGMTHLHAASTSRMPAVCNNSCMRFHAALLHDAQ